MRELLTTEQIAARLQVQPETVLVWARAGRLPVLRLSPKVLRFDPEAVDRALIEQRQPTAGVSDAD